MKKEIFKLLIICDGETEGSRGVRVTLYLGMGGLEKMVRWNL